jgi:hypothetical protein
MKHVTRLLVVLALLMASVAAPAAALAAGPPVNDDWANAPVITAIPYSDAVDTTEATTTGDTYNYCGGGSNTVWYRIELPDDTRVEISTAGSDFDTVIDLYEWVDPPGAFAPVACDDNSGPSGSSRLVADMIAGQVYAIMASSPSGQPGGRLSLGLSSVPAPANDDFDAATAISVLPFRETLDAGSATTAADDPASSCGGTGPSVWYDFTPASDGRYAISTQGTVYDTLVTVYTGSRGALSEVSCNDNYEPIGSYQARLRFDAEAGTTYHVGVTLGLGFQPRAGILEFAVEPAPAPPVNDDFDAATAMTMLPFGEDLDTSEATSASDDPTPSCSETLSSTVWYAITPTTIDRIRIQVQGGDFGPTVALYRGTRGALTEMSCSGGWSTTPGFEFDPQPGTTYHMLVGGATGDSGQLRVDATLAFVVRLTISGGQLDVGSGAATISGTITCNKPSFISTDFGELQQKVGRHTVRGPLGVYVQCDGTMPWTATVTGDSGPFVGGKADATLSLFGYASDTGESSQPTVTKTVTLKATRR